MPYIKKTSVVGETGLQLEYLPFTESEIAAGYREKWTQQELAAPALAEENLAKSASAAVEERIAPPEHEGVTEEEIRQLQAEDRGLGSFYAHYQQFSKR